MKTVIVIILSCVFGAFVLFMVAAMFSASILSSRISRNKEKRKQKIF